MNPSLEGTHSNESSPHSVGEYELHDFDSSSSSSGGDHSSPSDSAYTSPPARLGSGFPYDLGLSLVGIPPTDHLHDRNPSWDPSGGAMFGIKLETDHEYNPPGLAEMKLLGDDPFGGFEDEQAHLALTSDFWSTAPSTTVHSPAEKDDSLEFFSRESSLANKLQIDHAADQSGDLRTMEVDFEDVVHEDLCGPSTLASPRDDSTLASPSPTGPVFTPTVSTTSDKHQAMYFKSMSMPVDLAAVNAGISPQLTGGQPTPSTVHAASLGASQKDLELPHQSIEHAEKTQSRGNVSQAQSRDTSASRKSAEDKSHASMNLVTKDAVVASNTITSLVTTPPPPPLDPSLLTAQLHDSQKKHDSFDGAYKLLVLGVPTVGAKSRVETQIKISLVLVRSKEDAPWPSPPMSSSSIPQRSLTKEQTSTIPLPASKRRTSTDDGSEYMTSDGGLDPAAGDQLVRIGSWSHIALPRAQALKQKNKKQAKLEPPPEQTLFLDISVHRDTEPCDEVFICAGCQRREFKRAQRKKDARMRAAAAAAAAAAGIKSEETVLESNSNSADDEDADRKKVIVFNCAEFVEFDSGEAVLPTRITCYCRHHKERKGFTVIFTLRTSSGVVIASGTTPPIMITDDHKAPPAPLLQPRSLESNLGDPFFSSAASKDEVNNNVNHKSRGGGRRDKGVKDEEEGNSFSSSMSDPSSTSNQGKRQVVRPKTTSSYVKTESEEEADQMTNGVHHGHGDGTSLPFTSSTPAHTVTSRTASKKVKPYDSDGRPRKRSPASHFSPSFAMTPLNLSKPDSPQLRTLPLPEKGAHITPAPSPRSTLAGLSGSNTATANSRLWQMPAEQSQQHIPPWGSALGLRGMDDAIMADGSGGASVHQSPANGLNYSESLTPSPHSTEWRSSAPVSPASNATSNETFASFFNQMPSPDMSSAVPSTGRSSVISNLQGSIADGVSSSSQSAEQEAQRRRSSSDIDWSIVPAPGHTINSNSSAPLPTPSLSPLPKISRLIPGEGPVHGGIEVTILGENFLPNLLCVFGDSPATLTQYWSANTLVCVLPPSPNPGPVVVGIKGVPLTVEEGNGLQLFTYKDDSDRSLLELALQVVGLKMTGRLEDASAVAMRIVGNSSTGGAASVQDGQRITSITATSVAGQRASSTGPLNNAADLAMSMNAATVAVCARSNSRPSSRVSSRRGSIIDGGAGYGVPEMVFPSPLTEHPSESRNFEGIVIKFLSLLDLDPSQISSTAIPLPLPRAAPAISYANSQKHTLLHLATVLGFHRLVHFLLARGLEIDRQDRNGYTALHFAALYGRVAITRQLLEAGALSLVRTTAGVTAFDIARSRDDVDVQEVLLRYCDIRRVYQSRPTSFTQLPSPPPTQYVPASRPMFVVGRPSTSIRNTSGHVKEYYGGNSGEEDEEEEEEVYDDEEGSSSYDLDDSDESSFHTSDEESDESDVERGLSRNTSMVSLRYLIHAEGGLHEHEHNSSMITHYGRGRGPLALKAMESTEKGILAATKPMAMGDKYLSAESEKARLLPSTTADVIDKTYDVKIASSEKEPISWRNLNPKAAVMMPFTPITNGVSGVWEKAKLSGFALPPLQLPELTAFHVAVPANLPAAFSPRTWISGTGRETASDTSDVEHESDDTAFVKTTESAVSVHGGKYWRRNLYQPWWQSKANGGRLVPTTPPPMYSPTPADCLEPPPSHISPVASSSSSMSNTLLSHSPPRMMVTSAKTTKPALAPTKAQVQAKLQRRAGYVVPDEISDSVIQSYLHHERKMRGLRQDKMLFYRLSCTVHSQDPVDVNGSAVADRHQPKYEHRSEIGLKISSQPHRKWIA